ncbi:alpha-1,2-mannosyltransferase [Purpureocillium lavendulum]|uniref:Alpha-1,2-mannosyltransferase n=1 Tax=Purpureocillium lavendulum TaxID=1247861 RepID=A0AB34FKE3_9HYPO|nr:alpha-1,2-mannosyltransferase [Purpureocillium lavendulum]
MGDAERYAASSSPSPPPLHGGGHHLASPPSPRLGDFVKLQRRTGSLLLVPVLKTATASSASAVGAAAPSDPSAPSGAPFKLGDFRRVVSLLQVGTPDARNGTEAALGSSQLRCSANIDQTSPPTPPPESLLGPFSEPLIPVPDTDDSSAPGRGIEPIFSRTAFATSSTPGTSPSDADLSQSVAALSRLSSTKRIARPRALEQILSYQKTKYGAIIPVYGTETSRVCKHEALMRRLVPHRALDAESAALFPVTACNGVHVFLDMSNISISFHKALRDRHSIGENARFVPLPSLDLQFLTEVLTRGRPTVSLNVGCSVPPGRPEPRYVHELRKLGYHVDLRERKRVVDSTSLGHEPRGHGPAAFTSSSSSDDMSPATSGTVRYVEDLVDEVLQTRIAEAAMECFERQGTLVLATGDAQPAKHSDGFLIYADRALKMGWNVEVVSWKSSLSSHWRNPRWAAKWGNRFRVIELDTFLNELLACAVKAPPS